MREKLKWLARNGAKLIDPDNCERKDLPYPIEKDKWFFEMPGGMLYSFEYINNISLNELSGNHGATED